MKVKLKDSSQKLPNIWKECGVTLEDWNKLHSGKEIEMKEVPDSINHLVDLTTNKKEAK